MYGRGTVAGHCWPLCQLEVCQVLVESEHAEGSGEPLLKVHQGHYLLLIYVFILFIYYLFIYSFMFLICLFITCLFTNLRSYTVQLLLVYYLSCVPSIYLLICVSIHLCTGVLINCACFCINVWDPTIEFSQNFT